jgi:hypothetical protein
VNGDARLKDRDAWRAISETPVIIVTARDAVSDRVTGLDGGAAAATFGGQYASAGKTPDSVAAVAPVQVQ